MSPLLPILAVGALLLAAGSSKKGPPLMARTTVEGREYLIIRLKNGFEVSRIQSNVVTGTVIFKPGFSPTVLGKDTDLILADMNKFPVNIMK